MRDPDSEAHCLKIANTASERSQVGLRQGLRRWLAAHFPHLSENHAELRAWQRLHARLGSEADTVFADCVGLVATPWGEALRCRLVCDSDGRPAPSLYDHIFPKESRGPAPMKYWNAEALCTAVDRLEAWLIAHRVPLFDLNAGNFAVVERDGCPALVCIDLKSLAIDKEPLPLSRWVPTLMRRKLQRRAARLRARIRRHLPAET